MGNAANGLWSEATGIELEYMADVADGVVDVLVDDDDAGVTVVTQHVAEVVVGIGERAAENDYPARRVQEFG